MGPFLPLTALSGGIGLLQGLGTTLANRNYQRSNTTALEQLQARKKRGGLGLGGKQEELLQQKLTSPVQAAAAQARSRAEQIQASMGGGASGADLSRLRTEEGRTITDAAQNAALQVALADQQARQAQRQEIEQRLALQAALRRDNVNSFFGGASQVAGAAGALAAQPDYSKLFATGLAPEEASTLTTFAQSNPEEFARMLARAFGGAAAGAGTVAAGAGAI